MLDILLYPIITGIVGGIVTVIFEYFYVQPVKEKQDSLFKISQPLAFFLSVCAGVIVIELGIHFLFPNLNQSEKPLIQLLSDANIAFAACFYLVFTSLLLSFGTTKRIMRFIFIHLIPCVVFGFWVFIFVKPARSIQNPNEILDFVPILLSALFIWFYCGIRLFLSEKTSIVLCILAFPIIAIFANTRIITFQAYPLSFLTCGVMFIASMGYLEYFEELKNPNLKVMKPKPNINRERY